LKQLKCPVRNVLNTTISGRGVGVTYSSYRVFGAWQGDRLVNSSNHWGLAV